MTDIELNHWADCFIASNLRERMTFGQFLQLTPPLRERRLAQQAQIDALRCCAEQQLPIETTAHDGRLIAPMGPPLPRLRRPWFIRIRAR